MKAAVRLLLTFLAPGVVLLLVGVQVAFGLRGFDDPRGGFATVLEVPGLLVGWGSLAFLVPLLVWLVLDWWGVSASGLALKCLGAATLAIAVGAILGVTGGVAAGGHVGAALADLLVESLGPGLSIALLAAMAIPGLVLASAGFRKAGATPPKKKSKKAKKKAAARKKAAEAEEAPKRGFSFKRKKKVTTLADLVRDEPAQEERTPGQPWYPQREFDERGNELPMQFEARDVGEIRFAPGAEPDEDEIAAANVVEAEVVDDAPTTTAGSTDNLPTIPELLSGAYDEEALAGELDEASPPRPRARRTFAEPEPEEPSLDLDDPNLRAHVDGSGNERLVVTPEERVVQGLGIVEDTNRDEVLPPGVRWAEPEPEPEPVPAPEEVDVADDEPATLDGPEEAANVDEVELAEDDDYGAEDEEEAADDELELPPEEPLHEVMRDPGPGNEPEAAPETPSVRDSVLQALDGEAHSASSKRYLEKLEASGIFDFMDGDETKLSPTPKKRAAKKKAAKKKAAKKKAAARKKSAKKKAAARKKSAKKAAKKNTAARRRRGSSAKQTQNTPTPKTKPAKTRPPTATREDTSADAPSKARTWRTGPWRGGTPRASKQPDPEEEARTRRLHRERVDPRFAAAARICVDRGAASAVLLTRRLGVGFTEAKNLVERLEAAGVLGPASRTGSHPALLTAEAWDALT